MNKKKTIQRDNSSNIDLLLKEICFLKEEFSMARVSQSAQAKRYNAKQTMCALYRSLQYTANSFVSESEAICLSLSLYFSIFIVLCAEAPSHSVCAGLQRTEELLCLHPREEFIV